MPDRDDMVLIRPLKRRNEALSADRDDNLVIQELERSRLHGLAVRVEIDCRFIQIDPYHVLIVPVLMLDLEFFLRKILVKCFGEHRTVERILLLGRDHENAACAVALTYRFGCGQRCDTAAENYIVVIGVLYLGLIVLIHRDKVLFSDPADRTCFNRRVEYSSAYKTFNQHICTSIFIFQ